MDWKNRENQKNPDMRLQVLSNTIGLSDSEYEVSFKFPLS